MRRFFKKFAMVPRGLRYKLMIAFCLMSVIPMLVCVYLVNNFIFPFFPDMKSISQISLVVLLSLTVALLGLVMARKLVDPVIDMAVETRIIASGNYDYRIKIESEDEIGELGRSINMVTQRIKNYMNELHTYSLKTKDLNVEIQKKILALSNLLQIGDMIAAAEELDDILDLVTDKVSGIFEGGSAALYLLKEGIESGNLLKLRASHNLAEKSLRPLEFELGKGYLGKAVGAKIIILIDATTKPSGDSEAIMKDFGMRNCLILPVTVRKKVIGFLFCGNQQENFRYKEDDIELIKVLAKQVGIAIENDMLLHRAEELAFKDDLTGLYNTAFIKSRLNEEIRRAILCQRPCSFLIFNIDDFKAFRDAHGEMSTEEVLKKIARVLKENSTEIGRVGRLGDDEFAVVLPEKNKKEAFKTADEIRLKVEKACSEDAGKGERPLTISGGVSENPLDGSTAEELFKKASEALVAAKKEGKNRIVA